MPDVDRLTADAVGLGGVLTRIAEAAPDRPALVCGATRLSWADLESASRRLARALAARGIESGDLVAFALPNRVETVQLIAAAWKTGAVPLPLDPRLAAAERDAILALARPALVVDESALAPLMAEAATMSAGPLPDVATRPWKAVTSGGSTGRPKVILASDGGPRGRAVRELWGSRAWGASLIPGPLSFNGPLTRGAMTLLAGSTLVLMERFEPELYLELIEREHITWSLTVPTMWSRIVQLPEERLRAHDLSSLDAVLHSGAPMPAWLKRRVIDLLGATRVLEMYGATEVGATMIRGDDWLEHPGTVGRPFAGTRIEIRDDNGALLPPGEVGEIWIRPPAGPAFAYLGAEPRVDAAGFVSVGDLGSLDRDGYLTIADRRTDLILSGGANVYPAEVEGALLRHPAVGDVVVVGLPDERWGQRVHAIVEPRDASAPPSVADLDAFARANLSAYKIPKTYELVARVPRDTAGKVRRRALRDERSGEPAG